MLDDYVNNEWFCSAEADAHHYCYFFEFYNEFLTELSRLLHGVFMKIIGSALVAIPTIKLVFVMHQAEKRRQRLKSGIAYDATSTTQPTPAPSGQTAGGHRSIQNEFSVCSIADDGYTLPIGGTTTTTNVMRLKPSASSVSFNLQSSLMNHSPPQVSPPQSLQSPAHLLTNQISQSAFMSASNSTQQLQPPQSGHVLRSTNSQTHLSSQANDERLDSSASAATAAGAIALPLRDLQRRSPSASSAHTLAIPRPSQLHFASVTPPNGATATGGHSSRLGSAVSGIGISFRRGGAEETSCGATPSQLPTPSEELLSCHSFTTGGGTRGESMSVATISSRPACVKYKQKQKHTGAQQKKCARRHDQHSRTTLMLLVV